MNVKKEGKVTEMKSKEIPVSPSHNYLFLLAVRPYVNEDRPVPQSLITKFRCRNRRLDLLYQPPAIATRQCVAADFNITTTHHNMSAKQMRDTIESFTKAFASRSDIDTLMSHFSTTHAISAYEHGLALLAPFLGKEFKGRHGEESVPEYFGIVAKYLAYENMSFGEWVVDTEAHKICVKGRAKFTWIEGDVKGQSWEEEFMSLFDFDQDGKITDYQIWADTGAAYLARLGQLKDASKVRKLVRHVSDLRTHETFSGG